MQIVILLNYGLSYIKMKSTVLRENRHGFKSGRGRSSKIKLKLQIFSFESLKLMEEKLCFISLKKIHENRRVLKTLLLTSG